MTKEEALKVLDTIPTIGEQVDALEMAIEALEQEPKVGEWLEKEVISDKVIEEWQSARCSVCDKYHTTPYMYYFSHYEYCPNCGHRMKKEAEC
jgi:hypothetical protein